MCIVLRCCQENEAQSIFDLEHEINLSAFAELQPKPLVCVDGQPVSKPPPDMWPHLREVHPTNKRAVCVFFTLNRSSTRRHPAHPVLYK